MNLICSYVAKLFKRFYRIKRSYMNSNPTNSMAGLLRGYPFHGSFLLDNGEEVYWKIECGLRSRRYIRLAFEYQGKRYSPRQFIDLLARLGYPTDVIWYDEYLEAANSFRKRVFF